MLTTCPECNSPIANNAATCPRCGARFKRVESPTPTGPTADDIGQAVADALADQTALQREMDREAEKKDTAYVAVAGGVGALVLILYVFSSGKLSGMIPLVGYMIAAYTVTRLASVAVRTGSRREPPLVRALAIMAIVAVLICALGLHDLADMNTRQLAPLLQQFSRP